MGPCGVSLRMEQCLDIEWLLILSLKLSVFVLAVPDGASEA